MVLWQGQQKSNGQTKILFCSLRDVAKKTVYEQPFRCPARVYCAKKTCHRSWLVTVLEAAAVKTVYCKGCEPDGKSGGFHAPLDIDALSRLADSLKVENETG